MTEFKPMVDPEFMMIKNLREIAEKNPQHPTKMWFDGVRKLCAEAADKIEEYRNDYIKN